MRKKILAGTLVFMACLAFGNVAAVRAQSILEGKITGMVTDDKGEALPGVAVEITSPGSMGKRAVVTSAKGTFVFLAVPAGRYTLTASMPSFKTVKQDNINLTAERRSRSTWLCRSGRSKRR